MVYFGHRFYNPKHGRFLNRDPKEESGGNNLYAIVGNNVVNRWDVLGNGTQIDDWYHALFGNGEGASIPGSPLTSQSAVIAYAATNSRETAAAYTAFINDPRTQQAGVAIVAGAMVIGATVGVTEGVAAVAAIGEAGELAEGVGVFGLTVDMGETANAIGLGLKISGSVLTGVAGSTGLIATIANDPDAASRAINAPTSAGQFVEAGLNSTGNPSLQTAASTAGNSTEVVLADSPLELVTSTGTFLYNLSGGNSDSGTSSTNSATTPSNSDGNSQSSAPSTSNGNATTTDSTSGSGDSSTADSTNVSGASSPNDSSNAPSNSDTNNPPNTQGGGVSNSNSPSDSNSSNSTSSGSSDQNTLVSGFIPISGNMVGHSQPIGAAFAPK